ncbi:MAG: pyridoxal phosphate-dependent aminotransferase [Erysipelotrichaceae bacterium]|nr:pyridoxal phosphate-dependent aminotransferase [Erysipelotrichaceae bacterium]
MRAVSKPGDEIITFAPYFLEYQLYTAPTGAKLVVVEADTSSFQINFDKFEQIINEKTAAVLINTPNNPSGIVYSEETITKLAKILTLKQQEYGHEIFIISDEPYREIVFDNKTVPYVAKYYDNTLTCYSYSKSLSLPGERIGYVAVNPKAKDAFYLVPMMGQISRGLGHNNPSALIMRGVEDVCDLTCDMSVYETNMNLIYDKLIELGFEVVRPGGTFYIFPKALEEDANVFCQKALKYDLIFVPSDAFGVKGYFRMAYCIDTNKVKRSLPALERFVKTEYK